MFDNTIGKDTGFDNEETIFLFGVEPCKIYHLVTRIAEKHKNCWSLFKFNFSPTLNYFKNTFSDLKKSHIGIVKQFFQTQLSVSIARTNIDGDGPLPTPLATNQTKIPYPKPLKHSNKTNKDWMRVWTIL